MAVAVAATVAAVAAVAVAVAVAAVACLVGRSLLPPRTPTKVATVTATACLLLLPPWYVGEPEGARK